MEYLSEKMEIDRLLVAAKEELVALDNRRVKIMEKIECLKCKKVRIDKSSSRAYLLQDSILVTNKSSQEEKISLFRKLFRGREDVFPRRFESTRTGKTGYQPACRNEWLKGVCGKPKIKCVECENREFIPVTDEVIKNHLLGIDFQNRSKYDFTIGIYPLLADETCWFIAVDFDKSTWMKDISAFLEMCRSNNVPAILERSRSGNGGHVWIFFSEPIPAMLARKLGSFILTETMEFRPEIGLDSYDRFFPSQDTMPKGGFGNLIALPLQGKPRKIENSIFVDENFMPYPDQWAFLCSVHRMSRNEVKTIVDGAVRRGRVLGVRMPVTDEDDTDPWLISPSRQKKEIPIKEPLPKQLCLVLGNQIYIAKDDVPAPLQNRLIRLSAFQNPDFYKAQIMRLPTYNKPRIISCCEDFSKHIGLPRGCLDEVIALLQELKIKPKVADKRLLIVSKPKYDHSAIK